MSRLLLGALTVAILYTVFVEAVQAHYRAPWPWNAIADCETGDGDGKPPYRASWYLNGYFDGGLQFLPSTWRMAVRYVPYAQRYRYAYQAPAWIQVEVARAWLRRTSWEQWPACSRKVGLR